MTPIFLIGAGNMAWQLAHSLKAAGFSFSGVYSRTSESANTLANALQCPTFQQLDLRQLETSFFILAVPDGAMPEVLAQLKLPKNASLAHTSGSQPMALLEGKARKIGVFYPMQTVSKAKPVSFERVPIFIEASDPDFLQELSQIASAISQRVQVLSSEKRRRLHLSAIFACNFLNHQLAIADELLREDGLDISFLSHLIDETIAKAKEFPPQTVQTGPAIRHDHNTMTQHLQLLEAHPIWQEIYSNMSASIQEMG